MNYNLKLTQNKKDSLKLYRKIDSFSQKGPLLIAYREDTTLNKEECLKAKKELNEILTNIIFPK